MASVDRTELITKLEGAGAAAELCRKALLDGAELEVFPGVVSSTELRTIYRRRAEHLRQTGVQAIGADEAADRLERTPDTDLVIAKVAGLGGHFFQLLLDPALEGVVACLAVPARSSGPGAT